MPNFIKIILNLVVVFDNKMRSKMDRLTDIHKSENYFACTKCGVGYNDSNNRIFVRNFYLYANLGLEIFNPVGET